MVTLRTIIWMGQSNAVGAGIRDDLPASLRGPQANRLVFNYENNAIETLNCDAAGANQPNHTTDHTASASAILRVAELLQLEWGTVGLFHFAVSGTGMGHTSVTLGPFRNWAVNSDDLYAEFKTRFNAFIVAAALAGYEVQIEHVYWIQGENDMNSAMAESYYGQYRYFIKNVRDFVSGYNGFGPVKWVAGIPGTINASLPGGHIKYVNIVRSAIRRAGWDDANYRVVDMDALSYSGDNIHLTAQGLVDFGTEAVAVVLANVNNSMALSDYNLGQLRAHLLDEFGIDDSTANKNIIDDKINQAISWIVSRRKNWPWLERQSTIHVGTNIDMVPTPRKAVGCFKRNSSSILGSLIVNVEAPKARQFVSFNDGKPMMLVSDSNQLERPYTGDSQQCRITSISLANPAVITINLTSITGATVALPADFINFPVIISDVGIASRPNVNTIWAATRISANSFSIPLNTATGSGSYDLTNSKAHISRQFNILDGLFELPTDFIRLTKNHAVESGNTTNKLTYKPPQVFEQIIRSSDVQSSDRIYTVIHDPIKVSDNKFLWVYPYYSTIDSLYLKYYGDTKKLIADDDVSDVPRSDRLIVFLAAAWFVASWQKDSEMIAFYKTSSLEELAKMLAETEYSDDEEDRNVSNDNLGIMQSPGFPEMDV